LVEDAGLTALMGEDPAEWLRHGEAKLKREHSERGRRRSTAEMSFSSKIASLSRLFNDLGCRVFCNVASHQEVRSVEINAQKYSNSSCSTSSDGQLIYNDYTLTAAT
jgi:hypothetical protein